MENYLDENEHSDDVLFDRLVDGELDEARRRELLAGLDNEPGGWRRCALAFLEAQCWKQTFGVAQAGRSDRQDETPAALPDAIAAATPAPRARSLWLDAAGTLLAMATCFLMALGLGLWAKQLPLAGHGLPAGADLIADDAHRQPSTTGRPRMAQASQPATTLGNDAAAEPWQMVTVSHGQTPGASFRLPAVERNSIDQQWLNGLPPAIPENVLQALSRTGHQVQQRRQLVHVPLQDGRRLLMPVDQVEVHYVGNNTY